MKIFVISDIHGSSYFLKKALEAYEKEKADYILILGDELYHGPRNYLPQDYNPKEVSEILNKYKQKIIAVRGNCDSEVDQMLLEYPMMSDYTILLMNGKRIFATHGHIYSEEKLPNLSQNDVFIYGHTHLPVAYKKENIFILNPGSITLPKGGNLNSYGIFKGGFFYIKSLLGETIKKIELK
ncbi:MAG: phosphodiesterase [Cetobacterium sp.]